MRIVLELVLSIGFVSFLAVFLFTARPTNLTKF
jgi:hypothetical protein